MFEKFIFSNKIYGCINFFNLRIKWLGNIKFQEPEFKKKSMKQYSGVVYYI